MYRPNAVQKLRQNISTAINESENYEIYELIIL
jgi:hypothetical protein